MLQRCCLWLKDIKTWRQMSSLQAKSASEKIFADFGREYNGSGLGIK